MGVSLPQVYTDARGQDGLQASVSQQVALHVMVSLYCTALQRCCQLSGLRIMHLRPPEQQAEVECFWQREEMLAF